jgi:hypothetical protein
LDVDTHIDPSKLVDFHDTLLGLAQDDERSRRAWEESNSAQRRSRREENREEWLDYHRHMQAILLGLAAEHERKAAALMEGTCSS